MMVLRPLVPLASNYYPPQQALRGPTKHLYTIKVAQVQLGM
tara:strand:- start:49 stop:171 length:123 start_codon:yes stop_codon:yes gene_type:complete